MILYSGWLINFCYSLYLYFGKKFRNVIKRSLQIKIGDIIVLISSEKLEYNTYIANGIEK